MYPYNSRFVHFVTVSYLFFLYFILSLFSMVTSFALRQAYVSTDANEETL